MICFSYASLCERSSPIRGIMNPRRLVAIVALLLSAASLSAEDTYRINLSPPAYPGEQYKYEAWQKQQSGSYLRHGDHSAVPSLSYSEYNLKAVANVEACDAKGRPSQVKFTSASLKDFFRSDLIDPNSEVNVRNALVQNDPPKYADVFTLKDEPAMPSQAAALHAVVTIGSKDEPTDQEAFGPDKALAIGGSWSLGGKVGAQLFEKMNLKVDPASTYGTAVLVEKTKYRDVDCFHVRMQLGCTQYTPTLPANQTAQNGNATGRVSYYISVATGHVIEASYVAHSDVDITVEIKGKHSTFHTSNDMSRIIDLELLKHP
jgi:hypothetical protein